MSDLSIIKQIAKDIKTIKIQWATNIARAAFDILIQDLPQQNFKDLKEFDNFLSEAMDLLINARPTEPMLFNGMHFIEYELEQHPKSNVAEKVKQTVKLAQRYLDMINETAERAILNGLGLIHEGDNVLTHCHSSSVVKTIKLHKTKGLKFKIYNTETRPLFQWRKTSKALVEADIPTTMLTDSSVPYLVNEGVAPGEMIDCAIIGCDAIKLDGSIINKVGSYSLGLSALYANIPLYIAWNLLKIDINDTIEIEKRKSKEVWEDAPEGLKFINLAFDQIPPKFVRGIITEFGYIKPRDIEKTVKKHYPWMIRKKD